MRCLVLSLFMCTVLAAGTGPASAQEAEATTETPEAAPTQSEAVTAEPEPAPEPEAQPELRAVPPATAPPELQRAAAISYDELRLEELRQKARRTRNALIGTAAASVVGWPLWLAGSATQCYKYIDGTGSEQVECSTGGKVMRGIGIPLALGGTTGVLISGIMLGVQKGKIRDLKRKLAHDKSRAFRWDPATARFVF